MISMFFIIIFYFNKEWNLLWYVSIIGGSINAILLYSEIERKDKTKFSFLMPLCFMLLLFSISIFTYDEKQNYVHNRNMEYAKENWARLVDKCNSYPGEDECYKNGLGNR